MTIAQHWDISHYPFDRQHVRIILESADGEVDRVVLTPDTGGSKIKVQPASDADKDLQWSRWIKNW